SDLAPSRAAFPQPLLPGVWQAPNSGRKNDKLVRRADRVPWRIVILSRPPKNPSRKEVLRYQGTCSPLKVSHQTAKLFRHKSAPWETFLWQNRPPIPQANYRHLPDRNRPWHNSDPFPSLA